MFSLSFWTKRLGTTQLECDAVYISQSASCSNCFQCFCVSNACQNSCYQKPCEAVLQPVSVWFGVPVDNWSLSHLPVSSNFSSTFNVDFSHYSVALKITVHCNFWRSSHNWILPLQLLLLEKVWLSNSKVSMTSFLEILYVTTSSFWKHNNRTQ